MSKWKPIETAPKKIESSSDGHQYGRWILVHDSGWYGVCMARWWQSERNPDVCNFLEPGGNAVHPTHWQSLPRPPKDV